MQGMTLIQQRRATELQLHRHMYSAGIYSALGVTWQREATDIEDKNYHIDFHGTVNNFPGTAIRIAERVRDHRYRGRYYDVTQTIRQANGSLGEYYKTLADVLVYGWQRGGVVTEALLIDYRVLRMLTTYTDKPGGGHDGRQMLRCWSIDDLKAEGGVLAEWLR